MVTISKQVRGKCSFGVSEPSSNGLSQAFPIGLLGSSHEYSQDQ